MASSLRALVQARLSRNFAVFAAGNLISRALLFLVNVQLARALSPEGFGAVMLAQTVLLLVMTGTDTIRALAVRDVARVTATKDESETIQGTWGSLLTVGAFSLVVAIAVAGMQRTPSDRTLGMLFALAIPMSVLNIDWVLKGHQRFVVASLAEGAKALTYLVLVVLVVTRPDRLIMVPVAYVLGGLAAAGIVMQTFRGRLAAMRPSFSKTALFRVVSAATPVILNGFMVQLYLNGGLLSLKYFATAEAVGLFGASLKLTLLLAALSALFGETVLPTTAARSAASRLAGRQLTTRLLQLLGAVGVLVASVLAVSAPLVLQLLYGAEYVSAVPLLRILALFVPFYFVYVPLMNLLLVERRERELLVTAMLGCGVGWTMNLLLAGRVGAAGAALATVLSQIAVTTSAAVMAWRLPPAAGQPTEGTAPGACTQE